MANLQSHEGRRWLIGLGLAACLGVLGFVLPLSLGLISGCSSGTIPAAGSNDPPALTGPLADIPATTRPFLIHTKDEKELTELFKDMTAQSGIDHTYRNGQDKGLFAILSSLGGGAALIDYDGDGLLDVFLTGGGDFAGPKGKQVITGYGNRLFKNMGDWKFKEVTREAGVDQPVFYSHGAAVGDYDRDGWPDLLVTGWHRLILYHNEPDGKGGRHFVDVTTKSGLSQELWTTSAAWADLDGDGFPDLYVCQYVNWSLENNPFCAGYSQKIPQDVCPPKQFMGLPHVVYRNNGNGTFSDVSEEAGILTQRKIVDKNSSKGLGVVALDVNDDGRPDIYVANDTVDKLLYINESTPGKIRLKEVGLPSGAARDDRGTANGSMGIDGGDYDRTGVASLWCTNYEGEMHGLYKNIGHAMFLFSTPASGIAAIGQKFVGFGTGFVDIDHHGWEDILVTNGHVIHFPEGSTVRQKPVILRNKGKGHFVDITPQGGEYFRTEHIGRGLALGDLDNDGLRDVVICHQNEPAAVLRNVASVGYHWIGLELMGKDFRDVVGARVNVEAGGEKWTRFIKGGGSYLSAGDKRALIGLGNIDHIDKITVVWPLAKPQEWSGKSLTIDGYWRLTEGKPSPEKTAQKSPQI